jgi:ABC-type nitrate/sulfonate/bicarbonate transport system substrate-binding protein
MLAVHTAMAHRPHPGLRFLWPILGLIVSAVGGAGGAERVVLQLPYLHQFQFAGVYAAEVQGYFREAGLEVEVRPSSSERRSAVREVQEGRADYGVAQGHQLVAARYDGGDCVVLAPIMQHSPLVLLTWARDNLNTPHDLVGRRVALDDTAQSSEIRAMLESEGVGYDRITVVPNRWS